MADIETTTLVARQEKIGRDYPIFLERIILILVMVIFLFTFAGVAKISGDSWFSIIATWCLYPCFLLFTAEVIGRLTQFIYRNYV